MSLKWSEPAFSEENQRASFWIIVSTICWLLFIHCPYPANIIGDDQTRGMGVADAMLRDASFQRMREACFTEEQIMDYWYGQEFMKTPMKTLVLCRAREALCGGRGLCGCKGKEKVEESI